MRIKLRMKYKYKLKIIKNLLNLLAKGSNNFAIVERFSGRVRIIRSSELDHHVLMVCDEKVKWSLQKFITVEIDFRRLSKLQVLGNVHSDELLALCSVCLPFLYRRWNVDFDAAGL